MEHCECRHTMRTEKERKVLMTRLKTVEGQIRGIEKMVESDAYCPDQCAEQFQQASPGCPYSRMRHRRHPGRKGRQSG